MLFYECALLHEASGEHDRARERLLEALKMFGEMGMTLWEEKCTGALALL